MHGRVEAFLQRAKEKHHTIFQNCKVLEIGSQNVNGSPRKFFEGCHYIGIDCLEGKDVDLLGLACQIRFVDGFFDTIISTEVMEHDRFWKMTLINALRMLKPNGHLVLTLATKTREVHHQGGGIFGEYYKNLSADEILAVAKSQYNIEVLENEICANIDLYLILKKIG